MRIARPPFARRHFDRKSAAALVGAVLVLFASGGAPAQVQTTLADGLLPRLSEWLAPDATPDNVVRALTERASEEFSPAFLATEAPFLVALGRLAFRSPLIFGSYAARAGLSCDICHSAGGTNADFFVSEVSDRPGNVDVTHGFWRRESEDGLANPINIPSLRGVRWTAPYGRDGRFASLEAFTRNVIVHEFAGDEPPAVIIDALAAYQRALAFPAAAQVGPAGRLTAEAGADARRGEVIFRRDCAACHIPSAGFVDRRAHDVGTGGHFDTPTLFGLAASAPYFHDGRAAGLQAVITHFESVLGLTYNPTQRENLYAYLLAIGAEAPPSRRLLAIDLADLDKFADALDFPLNDEDLELTDLIAAMLRTEVGRIAERFPPESHAAGRDLLQEWSRDLIEVTRLAEADRFAEARDALTAWRSRLAADLPALARVESTSLYNPETLRRMVITAYQ